MPLDHTETGATDAKYQLTLACCGLPGLLSPHALFLLLAAAWKQTPALLWFQRGKFLAAKLSLAIWSAGQQALASFQAQHLSDAGLFH